MSPYHKHRNTSTIPKPRPGLDSSRRVLIIVTVAIMGSLAGYVALTLTASPGTVTTPVPAEFTVNGRTYVLNYTAVTEAERESGLMNRRVTNATTMLFAFPSPVRQPFWMYQTNTSLDIIWVSASGNSGTVVYVQEDAQPCPNLPCQDYPSNAQAPLANYVIEAKAGFAVSNAIAVGTTIQFG
jgi:uncharacterized membrane protein (UPF0127 family)